MICSEVGLLVNSPGSRSVESVLKKKKRATKGNICGKGGFLKLEWKSEEWLSVSEHISGTTCPIFTKLFVRVIYRRSSIFLWRRCDVLPVLWMTLCSHIIGHMGHVSSDEQLRSKIEYVQTKNRKNPPMNMYWILLNPILNRPPVCLSVRHTLMLYQYECCKVTAPILVTHQPPR